MAEIHVPRDEWKNDLWHGRGIRVEERRANVSPAPA